MSQLQKRQSPQDFQSGHHSGHRKPDPLRRKHRKMNNHMIVIILIVSILTAGALVYNTLRVRKVSTSAAGSSQTLNVDTGKTMSNDLYEIGNNPTQLEQTYFQQLTDALNSGSDEDQVTALVYNFVADYFTWTNKDGNYEVGGLQYIYSQKVSAFDQWNRYNYYKDMDLCISQYGRDNLPEVTEVTTVQSAAKTDDFTVSSLETAQTYSAWLIDVSWTYKMGNRVPADNFITSARFLVVDDDGRKEIAEWYDLNSVYRWSQENGVDPQFNSSSSNASTALPSASSVQE